jgi:hypothetical protein
MASNLVIGNTSQLSYFFPEDYVKISSRNIDMYYLKNNYWDSVYITFAEQRIHSNDVNYITPNYFLTTDIIENLTLNSNKIVVYTTCELWNNYVGKVSIDDPINYTYFNDYCDSKSMLMKLIQFNRNSGKWENVIMIHPFNFNSTYRKQEFLFGKIFDSIINEKKIEIGDTYFYKDIVHTKYMVERSIKSTSDEMVGSGRLTFLNDFIRDLYYHFDMDYDFWVKENLDKSSPDRMFYPKQKNIYTYTMLLNDTRKDIWDIKRKK